MFSDDDFISACLASPSVRDIRIRSAQRRKRISSILIPISVVLALAAARGSTVGAFAGLLNVIVWLTFGERAVTDIRMLRLSAALSHSDNPAVRIPTGSTS